ncbi:hypothetical protein SAMN02949497_2002 [Methylomagnum ishizawai]|uniref:Peptidase propeptide and YPEB domain-containing protein n=1 Tax=Methylomagnum ishizawai TaxID=1760988 RepID=A0A1Y6CWN4_9GAMM|nr:hypothetical protein [Methylomagnum ishizawai]SMF94676.1 hypothetical protein SAMN02949497_2002 [Methylomagnum ishizawai]
MKTNMLVGFATYLAVFGPAAANANDIGKDQVPKAVLDSFEQAHPNARDVEYEAQRFEGSPAYVIEFKENGREYESLYTLEGSLIRQQEETD